MFWEGESLLHIGWADTVKVARVRPAAPGASGEARRSLDMVASFQIECLIAVSSLSALQALPLLASRPRNAISCRQSSHDMHATP